MISLTRIKRLIIAPTAASISVTLVVTAGAFLAKVCGLGKELAVAQEFGAGPILDAFLFAYMFPALLVTVIGGAVGASIVPRFLATEAQHSVVAANRLAAEFAAVVACAATILVLIGIPVVTSLIPLLARGFSPESKALTISMVPLLMPIAAFSILSGLWSGLLNARHRFAAAAFVPMITPILVVTFLLGSPPELRIYALAVGTLLGAAIEVGILARVANRAGLELFRWPKAWRPEYGQILRQFVPAAGSSLLMSGTILIDQTFAAQLAGGSVSALSYGTKLSAVASSILVVVASTLALPVFSRLAAVGDLVKLRRMFFTACLLVACVTFPLAAVLSIGAKPIIGFLFMRGSFSAEDVSLAASIQLLHAWHLPVFVIGIVAVRALAAISETWLMMVGSVANLLADFSVNFLLVPVMGVAAIGLATTTMYTLSALVLCTGFLIRIGQRISRRVDA